MLAVSVDDTAQTALELIRSSKLTGNIFYCYVTDKEGKLAGVVPIRKLITAHKETEISDIMVRNPIRLTADSSADTALEYFVFYKFMYDSIVGSRNDFFPNGLLPNNNLAHRLLRILYHLALLMEYGCKRLETLILIYLMMVVKYRIHRIQVLRHAFHLALRLLVIFLRQVKLLVQIAPGKPFACLLVQARLLLA